jgi:sulfane dehydrogenase subunit SoxC
VAGNGLLHRRALLGRGIIVAGAMGAGSAGLLTGAAAEPLAEAPWGLEPGEVTPPYGRPSRFEGNVVRTVDNPKNEPRGAPWTRLLRAMDGRSACDAAR